MEAQSTPNNNAGDATDQSLSSLAVIGSILLIAGAGILVFFIIAEPNIISFNNLSASEAAAMSKYGSGTEIAIAAWGLYLAPIMIVTGAIFVAGGCVATAINQQK